MVQRVKSLLCCDGGRGWRGVASGNLASVVGGKRTEAKKRLSVITGE